MVVTLEGHAQPDEVRRALVALGLWVRRVDSEDGRTLFVIDPHSMRVSTTAISAIAGVESVCVPKSAHPLVDAHPRVVKIGRVTFGGPEPVVIAGPCAVESLEHVRALGNRLAEAGVQMLRGGAFKPRTSPYEYQGAGLEALSWLRSAADEVGLPMVTEALGTEDVSDVAACSDLVQVGSRNMHNYALLRSVGRAGRPVLLKRGMSATIEEWLQAAEYCLLHGAPSVVFCERGIRSFDPSTRNVLDLGAVAILAHVHRLPVIADPSHGTGRRELVSVLARAAVAAGACGVMVEAHDSPGDARSDGPQAISPEDVEALVQRIRPSERTRAIHA